MDSNIILNNIATQLFKKGKSSFYELKQLDRIGIIDKLIEDKKIDEILKRDFTNYLRLLLEYNYPFYYNRKLRLEGMLYPRLNPSAEYILCLYCGHIEAYNNLPLLLLAIIEKFNICEFDSVTLNQLISSIYNYYDIKDDCDKVEPIPKFKGLYTDYSKYDNTYDINQVNVFNKEEFFVWSEHRTFDLEDSEYKEWVSRYNGDGYGFDIISFDSSKKREKLIEVKSGMNEYFTLTENEYNIMKQCHFKNADYYIYKYTYNILYNTVETSILKYDFTLDILFDQNNNIYSYNKDEFGYNVHKATESEKKLILKDR